MGPDYTIQAPRTLLGCDDAELAAEIARLERLIAYYRDFEDGYARDHRYLSHVERLRLATAERDRRAMRRAA